MSLRSALSIAAMLIALLGVGSSVALIVITTVIYRSGSEVASAVESVRQGEEAEIDLLLHNRALDPLVRREIEADLRRRLAIAGDHVTTALEAQLLAIASERVEEYIRSSPSEQPRRQEIAFESLEALVSHNTRRSESLLADMTRSNRIANWIGVALGMLVLATASVTIVWVRGRAFLPVFELGKVMQRFASGERTVRAREEGPTELCEMSRHFNALAEALSEQRLRQASFLASVAHDIRTPLNTVMLSLARVRDDAPLPPEEALRRSLSVIKRQCTRLHRLTSDFLDLSRIDSGAFSLVKERIDVVRLAVEVADLFTGSTDLHTVEVRAESPVVIDCDPVRMNQLLTNLVSNAIKYSPNGGRVLLSVEEEGDRAVISVSDEGIGIAEADVARIFEPYHRVPGAPSLPGLGLGLYVVSRILQAHGGTVQVESAPGRGTRITIRVPRPVPEQPARWH